MNSLAQFALAASNVYSKSERVASDKNTVPIDQAGGWSILSTGPSGEMIEARNDASGFLARAYDNGNEIVVAYAGTTDETLLTDWINGNVPAATALTLATQILEAARFYLRVQAQATAMGKPVVFTGHSLGGGLACLMSVYFNKPAVVFDPAQFEKSADSDRIVNLLRESLLRDPARANIGDFATYQPGSLAGLPDPTGIADSPSRLARQRQIQSGTVEGDLLSATEILSPERGGFRAADCTAESVKLLRCYSINKSLNRKSRGRKAADARGPKHGVSWLSISVLDESIRIAC